MTDLSRCPAHESFQPFSEEYLIDPYPTFAAVREESAAFFNEELGMWVVTRYQDCATVMSDTERLSSRIAQDPLLPFGSKAGAVLAEGFGFIPTMTNLDLPEHTRIRRHNMTAFSTRRVADLEPVIRDITTRMLDEMLVEPRFDWVSGLAFPLPITVIFSMLGFPDEDAEMLKEWTTERLVMLFGHPTEDEQVKVAANMKDFWSYCVAFVAKRTADRSDDFTSALLDIHDQDNNAISIQELTSVIFGLSIAGHETTTNLLANAVWLLLRHRDQWDEVCSDQDLIPGAVEEALRFDSSVNAWRRWSLVDVELSDGTVIPAESKILVLLGSANRDDRKFDDPDRFNIHREDARRHLSFGKGIHFCLGAPLARLEARVVLEELTSRAPELAMVEQELEFAPIISFRGPNELWLTGNQQARLAAGDGR